MVMRESSPTQVGGAYQPNQLQVGRGPGQAQPDFAKHVTGESAGDRLAQKLISAGAGLAKQAWNTQIEEKYLAGVAAASAGKAEAELEGGMITGAWETAGYRDTMGKLSMADANAKLLADMPDLVQKTPEQFKQYLDEHRAPLIKQMNGMSRQQRAAMFGQLASDLNIAGKKYEVGRAQWIVDQKSAAIQANMTARRANMAAATSDLDLYSKEVDGFVGSIYADVWSDPSLPQSVKVELTRQAAEFAASGDNTMVYDRMQTMTFKFGDGKESTLMQRLPFEDQIKMDKAQRSAMDRVKASRSRELETQFAVWFSEWRDKDIGATQSYAEVSAVLDMADHAGLLAPGKRESVLTAFFSAQARNSSNSNLATAYMAGDVGGMTKMGKSQKDGLDAYMKSIKDEPFPQQVMNLMTIGNNQGLDTALTKAGELLAPAVAQMGMSDEILPENAQLVQSVAQALDHAELTNPGARSRFVQAMGPEQQDMFLYLSEAGKAGINDASAALKWAKSQVLADQSAGGVRSTRIAANNKADALAVSEIAERQLLGTISSKFSLFADSKNQDALRTGRSWFENTDRVNEVLATTQMAYADELALISKTSPFMSDDSRKSKALAALANRTLDTESGPLTMPRGQSVQSYFGVPAMADKELVGQAIDALHKPAEGNRLAWSTTADNQLLFREFSKDGKVTRSGVINPKSVAPKVNEIIEQEAATASKLVGPGVVHESGGAKVQYNGLNTGGIEPSTMLKLRDDIVRSEGVRDTAYADSGGKSFGVGIHETNSSYEMAGPTGVYTQGQIDNSFATASNTAANQAIRTMKRIGVDGEDYIRFLGELAYQSPKSARDPALLAAIQVGDKERALKALQETNAYKGSHPERRAQYTLRLSAAMR